MSKRLSDNLNSLYISAANRMKSKQARHKIVAYVESYDDVFFWRNILGDYEDDKHYFEVMLPSSDSLAKGKKTALSNMLGPRLGANMIACVDSDYDYLLQDNTQVSRYINHSKYVLQTYVYAIENYQCYAQSLHDVCTTATLNDHRLLDFEEFMKIYSRIVYPLFLWSVWYHRKGDVHEFSLMDFCGIIGIDRVNPDHPERSLQKLEKKVNRKLRNLRRRHPEAEADMTSLKGDLGRLGITPDTTYLFVQGHHIMESVIYNLLIPVCTRLRKERESEISRLAEHGIQRSNELSCYRDRQLSVESVLRRNTNFKQCGMYKKLDNDIKKILSNTK